MANSPIKPRRGLEANRTSITPLSGELIITTDNKKAYIGDSVTAGGNPLSYVDNFSNENIGGNKTFLNDVIVDGALKIGSTNVALSSNQLIELNTLTTTQIAQLSNNLVSGTITTTQIPNLDASIITSGTFNSARIPELDASKITSGILNIAQIPQAALERLVPVANQAARYALTTATTHNGDTVKEQDTGYMYFVVDQTQLNSDAGYNQYTTSTASSVGWSGVLGIPSQVEALVNLTTTQINQLENNLAVLTTGYLSSSVIPGLNGNKIASGTIDNARINLFSGEGTSGRVPASATGDAAASKFLKADGSWAVVQTSSDWSSVTNKPSQITAIANLTTTAINQLSSTLLTSSSSISASNISGALATGNIPNLDASKINSGTLNSNQIPNLDGAKITTGTVVAARLPAMTGDTGSGGASGLVPAPSAGDASAGKFLKADGSWVAIPASTWDNVSNKPNTIDTLTSLSTTQINQLSATLLTSSSSISASNITGTLTTTNIPSLDASKIATGTFTTSQIPNLDSTKITSGTMSVSRLPTMVGDTGGGGTAGLVPAPALGDAAASKFLKADGTWTVVNASSDWSTLNNKPAQLTELISDYTTTQISGLSSRVSTINSLTTTQINQLSSTLLTSSSSLDATKVSGTLTTTNIPTLTASKISDFSTTVASDSSVTGKITGPGSSTDGGLMVFSGTTGKIAKVPVANILPGVAVESNIATVASDPTASAIWAATADVINFTGTATITNFPAATQAGMVRKLICAGACTFTNNANISVQGNATYIASAGDIVEITAITTTTFRLTVHQAASLGSGISTSSAKNLAFVMSQIFV